MPVMQGDVFGAWADDAPTSNPCQRACVPHLVNKSPLNRIVELCGVSFPTLYDKIRFIHRQCSLFAASRETRLPGMDLGRRYLCTDRQDYIVNWGSRTNRKTIQLTAVATADRESGYVFAFSPNFDASLDQDAAEAA
jgi:hypothetical protein